MIMVIRKAESLSEYVKSKNPGLPPSVFNEQSKGIGAHDDSLV